MILLSAGNGNELCSLSALLQRNVAICAGAIVSDLSLWTCAPLILHHAAARVRSLTSSGMHGP